MTRHLPPCVGDPRPGGESELPAVAVEQIDRRGQARPLIDHATQRVEHVCSDAPVAMSSRTLRSPRSSVPSSVAFEDITTFTLPDIPLGISPGRDPDGIFCNEIHSGVDGSRAADAFK